MGLCESCCPRPEREEKQTVELSTTTNAAVSCKCALTGKDVKSVMDVANNFYKIEGSGTALGSCPLDCDTGYWEVRIGANPAGVTIGVKRYNAKKPVSLDTFLDDPVGEGDTQTSWTFRPTEELKTGDVVGIYWDQTDLPMLNFAVNGVEVPSASILRIRPANDILAAVSVKAGSSCEFIFDGDHFLFPPKTSKFKMIVCATSLI
jgi:hypothetical protein